MKTTTKTTLTQKEIGTFIEVATKVLDAFGKGHKAEDLLNQFKKGNTMDIDIPGYFSFKDDVNLEGRHVEFEMDEELVISSMKTIGNIAKVIADNKDTITNMFGLMGEAAAPLNAHILATKRTYALNEIRTMFDEKREMPVHKALYEYNRATEDTSLSVVTAYRPAGGEEKIDTLFRLNDDDDLVIVDKRCGNGFKTFDEMTDDEKVLCLFVKKAINGDEALCVK